MIRHTVTVARAAATLEAVWHGVGRAAVDDGPGDLTLRACVVPWDVAARVTDDGRTFYDETWARGSLIPDDRVVIYDGHVPAGGGPGRLNADRQPIGRASGFEQQDDGLWATLTLANTARGRDVYELARTLGHVDVSLETDVPLGGHGTVARTAAEPCALTGIAVVLPPGRGAFPGALAAAARAAGDEDDDDDETDGEAVDEPGTDAPPADGAAGDTGSGRAGVAEIVRREMARYGGRPGTRAPGASGPLARYRSFREFATAAREARDDRAVELNAAFTGAYHAWRELDMLSRQGTVGRALVDQITADNPGLMPPTWLTEVFGIVDRGRPGITALGGPRSPGSAGMDIYWPYYDGDLTTLVAEQVAQKSPITSVKVSFKRGSATLDTYAGGSDVAFQLIRRSSPSYMALYNRILNIAFGLTTEFAFDAAIAAGAGVTTTYDATADTDGSGLRAVLFAASSAVRDATGEPASVALLATDVWLAIGGMAWLQPAMYGTQNVPGTAQASNLRVNVSGLEMTEAPGLPDGTMIVTNTGGAAWFEDGPFIVTADDVEKLGTNVAIWGMGTPGLFLPSGIVAVTVTLPAPIALMRRDINVDRAVNPEPGDDATSSSSKRTAK
jgi:hypothetical protein